MMVQRPTGSTAALSPGRVCRVAEACSADLKSAVSQVCNLRIVGKIGRLGSDRCPADYKSAIRQIENLRYGKHIPGSGRTSPWEHPPLASLPDTGAVCSLSGGRGMGRGEAK